jgi:hypothetical protein
LQKLSFLISKQRLAGCGSKSSGKSLENKLNTAFLESLTQVTHGGDLGTTSATSA